MSRSTSPIPSSDHAPPSLDRLVGYFVSAKKSLAATTHVYRANEIVEDARLLVEEGAVLTAKNTYVRSGVQDQVRILKNIHSGLEAVGLEAQIDFQSVIKSLDVANDRLQVTLSSLRKTIVSASLGGSQQLDQEEGAEVTTDKTLYDFIDESTHTKLLDSLRATIDSYNDAQATLHRVRTSLGTALDETTDTLAQMKDSAEHPDSTNNMPELFHSLSVNATEMASLLQSLISHYDLCISALKHTEGGGEAARAATFSSADPVPLSLGADSPTEASLYAGADAEAHRAPISDAERDEMLAVVAADAAQVDDVVHELRDRAAEMNQTLSSLDATTAQARSRFDALSSLVSRLASLSTTLLPSCVTSSTAFRAQWIDLRTTLVSRTSALADLCSFYDAFLASYASLLREVDRRNMVEAKMKKIADRALRDIDALRAEDKDMRDQFLKDVGDWLPRDIWPGLVDGPVRFELRRVRDRSNRGLGIAAETEAGQTQSRGED